MSRSRRPHCCPSPPDEAFALHHPARTGCGAGWPSPPGSTCGPAVTFRWTLTPVAVAGGTVVEVEPGRRLVLASAGSRRGRPAAATDTVTITIEPADGGTLVRLVHDGLPDAEGGGRPGGLDALPRAARAGRRHR